MDRRKSFFWSFICVFLYFSLSSNSHAENQTQVLFAIDLIRHGDRTPIREIPSSPYSWPEGLGNLTQAGQDQQRELGKRVRAEYVTEYEILPPEYDPNLLKVRSTQYQRTILSAKAFLEGLYSKPESVSIPVETIQKTQDPLLPPYGLHSLADLQNLLENSGDRARHLSEALKSKINPWRASTGLSLTSADDLLLLGDNLFIRGIYHVPFPKDLDPADIDTLQEISHVAIVENCSSRDAFVKMGRNFLQTVLQSAENVTHLKTQQRVQLYFAHDATILGVTSALGVRQKELPHYASRLNFLVLRSTEGTRILTSFNGVTTHPPACQTASCTLKEFKVITSHP